MLKAPEGAAAGSPAGSPAAGESVRSGNGRARSAAFTRRPDVLSALRRRAATAIRRRRDVRHRGTPDDVHDLRVATRRLQELIDLLGGAIPEDARRRLRRRVQRVRRSLAEVRDADVQLQLVESLAARLGPLAARPLATLRARFRARAAAARDGRRRAGAGLAVRGLRGRVRALFAATPVIPRARVAVAARRALRTRAGAVVSARARALRDGAAAMHALRIAVKKYRYTLEFMDEVGLGRHEAALAEARRLQDALGRLHDLDLLAALTRRAPGAVTPGLRALLREERRPLLAAARAEAAAFVPKRPAPPPAMPLRGRRPLP